MPNYRLIAVQKAKKYGIDPNVFLRQIKQESGFDPAARSGAGAIGIAQFEPATARQFGVDPTDPVSSLDGAARMDAANLKRYGSYERMLSAYNSGRPDAYKDPHFAGGQTFNYVKDILGGKTPKVPGRSPSASSAPRTPTAALGTPTQGPALTSLLGSLQSLAERKDSDNSGWGFKSLATTVQQIHANREAQQEAAQYGDATGPVQLGSGHVVTGYNPNSPTDQKAVKLAESYIGTPYVWGGAKPGGFDCSGLLQYTWGKLGVKIPRTTYDQFKTGKPVGPKQLAPGDAVFFKGSDSKNGLPGHVGMYIGGGKFIEAPHTGSTVHISTLAGRPDYMGARRFA